MTLHDSHTLTGERRQEMIAIAAYYLAERRGFTPGQAETDWLEAERLIDALIAEAKLVPQADRQTQGDQVRYALKLAGQAREA